MTTLLRLTVFATFLAILAPGTTSANEEMQKSLKNLQTVFSNGIENIDGDFLDNVETCRNGYGSLLVKAEETATANGDLDAVMKIRKERARFTTDRAVDDEIAPGTHASIEKAIKTYLKNLDDADRLRAQKEGILARQYVMKLEDMKKKLTTSKRIDDALLVQSEIERIKADPQVAEALASAPPPPPSGESKCDTCSGKGVATQSCATCGGTGACSYCEGTGRRIGLGGNGVACFACTGGKKCKKCNGTGQATTKCSVCQGTGRGK